MPLSHAITCPFPKLFQILYISAQILKYVALFFVFPEKLHACPYFLEQALAVVLVFINGQLPNLWPSQEVVHDKIIKAKGKKKKTDKLAN